MANTISTSQLVANTALNILGSTQAGLYTSSRAMVPMWEEQTFKPGYSINCKLQGYPIIKEGLVASPDAIVNQVLTQTLTENDIMSVFYELDQLEATVAIKGGNNALMAGLGKDMYSSAADDRGISGDAQLAIDNYGYPASVVIGSRIEEKIALDMTKRAWMSPVSLPSQLKSTFESIDMTVAETFFTDIGIIGKRYAMINSRDSTNITNSLQNILNQNLNDTANRKGWMNMDEKNYFSPWRNSFVRKHLPGAQHSVSKTFTVSAATVTNGALTAIKFAGVDSVTTQLFNAGDRIAIPTVNLFSTSKKISLDQTLVVTVENDTNGNGDGTIDITFTDPLFVSGTHRNIVAAPAASAPCELFPAHYKNFFYVPEALYVSPLRMQDLWTPFKATAIDKQRKIVLQVNGEGSTSNSNNLLRIKMLAPIRSIPYTMICFESAA